MPSSHMKELRLRQWCEEQVERLHLPYPATTRALRDAIAERRGKPISIRPLSTLGAVDAPCGMRIETPDADLLFYEEGTSVHHQRHILTHELCHVYCDHPGNLEVDAKTARFIGLNPALMMRMAGRTRYSTDEEREAEMMASVIRWRIYRDREAPPPHPSLAPERWDALFAQPFRRRKSGP
ncbi:regulator component [Streptomyces sp. NPDC013181]|uniref:regulator component n=1 Tax=Streptomyces sp. NPDC013181 TaxID=3364864 RepID=UPI0036C0F687